MVLLQIFSPDSDSEKFKKNRLIFEVYKNCANFVATLYSQASPQLPLPCSACLEQPLRRTMNVHDECCWSDGGRLRPPTSSHPRMTC